VAWPSHHGVDYRKRHRTVEQMSQPNVRERGETVTSIRQAAAVRNVSPPVVRRWMLIVPVRGAQVDFERRRSGALPDDGLPPPDTSGWDELAAMLGPERASSVDADFGVDTTRRFRVTLRWTDGTGSRSTVEQLELH